ncbi:hypothetical protein SOV88_09445 [Pectobacterium brasiliense]|uniref:hypothetical protein n=1 Tax=Pectobacterium TaxID=122277 RepID=UPI00057C6219|nr:MULTISPECIES: hypothetical protein [Pectobacterium]KHT29334.1 hypothetical protein RC98_00530 [Pectobacterium carotovorum subsp. carotovorum]MDY4324493.1 hypothetical protein [Pectobacterium brasiliense]
MNTINILSNLFLELQREIESLSDADIKKIESGAFTIGLKIIKNAKLSDGLDLLSDQHVNEALNELKICKDRKLGYEILSGKFKTRKELEFFAKKINIYVMKQDKIDTIKEKIVEGVIGASLRSMVIQGDQQ